MEKELNIAEILKDKPKGIKLWSPAFGQCKLCDVALTFSLPIDVEVSNGTHYYLLEDTRIYKDGKPMLFPSEEMRDWEKFAWKKGDVIVNNINDISCVFDGWRDNEYETFTAKFIYSSKTWCDASWFYTTNNFAKSSDSEAFINMIEEQYGGKLNLSTLEIERQPEFKDGDILTFCSFIFIYKMKDANMVYSHVSYDTDNKDCIRLNADMPFCINSFIADFKYATREEKQRLFDALAKEGKQWDAEKKQIVDLQFKPFDKVLVRNLDENEWKPDFFSKYYSVEEEFGCISGMLWKQCIPYNDSTKHLLGTTDDWKGGE